MSFVAMCRTSSPRIIFEVCAMPDKRLLKGDDEWDWKRVLEYLEKKERFLELLMLAMHMTGGQPA